MRALVLALLLLNAVAIGAGESADRIVYEDQASGFRFPQMIAAYELVDTDDYGRGNGTGVHYASEAAGANASIYIYTKQFTNLADGIDDMRVRHELSSIDSAMAEMVRRGDYQSIERVDLAPMSKAWLQVSHDVRLPGGKMLKSYSFMRVQNGYFVKLRVSAPADGGGAAGVPMFLVGISRAIGLLGGSPR